MRETAGLFAKNFLPKLAALRAEMAVMCLSSHDIDVATSDLRRGGGDTDRFIEQGAKMLRTLSSFLPPESFSHYTDDHLLRATLDQSAKVNTLLTEGMKNLKSASEMGSPDAASARFAAKFRQCCFYQTAYLRSELIKRMGPSACDEEEIHSLISARDEVEVNGYGTLAAILDYEPHFDTLVDRYRQSIVGHKGNGVAP